MIQTVNSGYVSAYTGAETETCQLQAGSCLGACAVAGLTAACCSESHCAHSILARAAIKQPLSRTNAKKVVNGMLVM
jgi:hypothetical protein